MLKARLAALALALSVVGVIPVISLAASSSPDTIFGSSTPRITASGDSNGVELGVRFSSTEYGEVTGVRFYKGRDNTGTHVGSLYSSSGQLLASATFTNESSSGWQTVTFASPVTIEPGTTYVAAYYAPHGHYSETVGGLSRAVTNGPLTALANSKSGNGIYAYASSSTFPINSFEADNYWVDVAFAPTAAATSTTSSSSVGSSAGVGGTTPPTTTPVTTTPTPPAPAAPSNSTAPSITGTTTQGNALTANNGTWTGSPTSYSYQWQDCTGSSCTSINGATASTYTLQSTDVSDTIDVQVTATNAGGNTTSTSAKTATIAAPTPAAPSNSTAPSITGTATQGNALTANNGTWTGSPTSYSYQWQDCTGSNCTSISGATSSTYTLQSTDVSDTIDVQVTATNAGGNTTSTSAKTATIAAPTPAAPSNSTAPSITGTATQGDALTANNGTWTGSPSSYGYQWQHCTSGNTCTNISGATSSTYTLQSTDVNDTVDVQVTATNAGGNNTATSAKTATVAAATPAAPTSSTAPSITGTATQGDALTANNGTWTGSPTSYSYQWQDCTTSTSCTNISGATNSVYTLQSTDVNDTVDVQVTATNAGGHNAATSTQTAAVQATSVQSSSSAAAVGIAAEPSVTCTKTITPSTTLQSALNTATAGSTICLNGTWTSTQSISAVAPSSDVTVAAVSPGAATLSGGLNIGYGLVSNLTFEGIQFGGGVSMTDCAANLSFVDNNFQDLSDASAFYLYYGGNGDSSCTQTGINIEYNQIDHAGECLEEDSNSPSDLAQESGIDFSHNVCGPDIGYGCNAGSTCDVSGHYIQMGNTSDDTINNNAFTGPGNPNWNPSCNPSYSHINVFHMTGSSSNTSFSNNIIWHTGACGESVMFQSGGQVNDAIDNNLLVENTGVGISYNLYGADGLTFNHNTIVEESGGGGVGLAITGGCTDCGSGYLNPQNVTADDNLGVSGAPNFGSWTCSAGTCNSAGNVSSDSSALSWGPESGDIGNWTPSFQTTSWSPNSGSPWSPPPSGYYQPTGLSVAAGYQGTVGP